MIVHDADAVRILESLLERAGTGAKIGDDLLRCDEVMPPHLDTRGLEPPHEGDGRRSSHILGGRTTLEGKAGDEDLGVGGRAAKATELVEDARGHMIRQRLVDLPGLFDNLRLEVD